MEYQLDNQIYKVEIVRKNNKNIYVRVKDNNVIYVTANYFTTKNQIINILDNNQSFLRKALAKKKKEEIRKDKIFYLGKEYDLVISNLFSEVEVDNNKIYAKNMKHFENWYKKEMKRIFEERYNYYYHQFEEDIPFFTLKFRLMKTRWGVCNRKSKTITLNTKLLEYDSCCLDYVIVHELSHLIEFNHSSNFWRVVKKYYPNYKIVRKILKD